MDMIELKPVGSVVSHSEMTGNWYHSIEQYQRIRKDESGFTIVGIVSKNKHLLGGCKYCKELM